MIGISSGLSQLLLFKNCPDEKGSEHGIRSHCICILPHFLMDFRKIVLLRFSEGFPGLLALMFFFVLIIDSFIASQIPQMSAGKVISSGNHGRQPLTDQSLLVKHTLTRNDNNKKNQDKECLWSPG